MHWRRCRLPASEGVAVLSIAPEKLSCPVCSAELTFEQILGRLESDRTFDRLVQIRATLNKPSKISAQTWMTQFFGLLCLSRGPFGQFAGR